MIVRARAIGPLRVRVPAQGPPGPEGPRGNQGLPGQDAGSPTPYTSGLLIDAAPIGVQIAGSEVVELIDVNGVKWHKRGGDPIRIPASGDIQPLWGLLSPDGQFLGFDVNREVHGHIKQAYSLMGRSPAPAQIPDAWIASTDSECNVVTAVTRDGLRIDYGAGRAPMATTEWLSSTGVRVAPFTALARECVVAYLDGERRVLTPYSDYHFRAPVVAYGGKSVRCWRVEDGEADSTGLAMAVSMDGSGFMAPDDPDRLHVVIFDGQSLAQGSLGTDAYPWRVVSYPSHTLVMNNTVNPGDVRLGRNATVVGALLDRATLSGFTAIQPQAGVATAHGFTPAESFALTLQDEIVRRLGRPQRLSVMTLGVGGQAIAAIGVGTANHTSLETAMEAIVEEAALEGWTVSFDAAVWIHGEGDVATAPATYQAALDAWIDSIRTIASGLGSALLPKAIVYMLSSTREVDDNETTNVGMLGTMDCVRARPEIFKMAGPHYPIADYYTDLVHFTGGGYFRLGEIARDVFWREVWGTGGGQGLYIESAVYNAAGPTITLTWSHPIDRDAVSVPVRAHDGIEVSIASNSFATITSHTITPGSATSVILLAGVLASPSTARVHVAMLGQSNPRTLENVPCANVRTESPHDYGAIDRAPIYRWAVHDRVIITE